MAFIAAAAAPGASIASTSSLRGYDHDNGSGSGTPIRLLKPDPDLLPAQANTDMPELELPSAAQANAQGIGRPFDNAGAITSTTTTTTTTGTTKPPVTSTTSTTTSTTTEATTTTTTTTTAAGCAAGWKLNERYCLDGTGGLDCLILTTCPPSTANWDEIGKWDNYGNEFPVNYVSPTESDTSIVVSTPDGGTSTTILSLSGDGNSITENGNTWAIATATTSTTTTTKATTTTTKATTTTAAGCAAGWKLNQPYCRDGTDGGDCYTFNTCPTSTAVGTTIGEGDNFGNTSTVGLYTFISDTLIVVTAMLEGGITFYLGLELSADGSSFTDGTDDWTIAS